MPVKLVLVEDTYGVEFHKTLINKLREKALLDKNMDTPLVKRLPARECNPKILRETRAIIASKTRPTRREIEESKILVVIDQESQPREEARQRVLKHFKPRHGNQPVPRTVRVVVVEPRHETWLCIGLGLDPRSCTKDPETAITRKTKAKSYSKDMLARLAPHIDPGKLLGRRDFREYLEALRQLHQDP